MGHLSRKFHSFLERSASWVGGVRGSATPDVQDSDVAVEEEEASKESSSKKQAPRRRQLMRRWSWGSSSSGGAPKGYLPVRAGDSRELFYIRAEHLNHPLISDLLQRSAEEYGFDSRHYTGALRLPCDPAHLRLLLRQLRLSHSPSSSSSSSASSSSSSIFNSCSLQHHHHHHSHGNMAFIQ